MLSSFTGPLLGPLLCPLSHCRLPLYPYYDEQIEVSMPFKRKLHNYNQARRNAKKNRVSSPVPPPLPNNEVLQPPSSPTSESDVSDRQLLDVAEAAEEAAEATNVVEKPEQLPHPEAQNYKEYDINKEKIQAFNQEQPLAEDENIDLEIERTHFKRQKKFLLTDYHYLISIKNKIAAGILTIFTLLATFQKALTHALKGK